VAEHFDWVHSVDRLKIAERLSRPAPGAAAAAAVCLQVNITARTARAVLAPADVPALARAVAALPRLRLRGLMASPQPASDVEAQRRPHRRCASCWRPCERDGLELDTLSMGMTADLEAGGGRGATLVRIGTALFGARPGTPA
jgi:pyridoxal phosphate enzyme (YggS family)